MSLIQRLISGVDSKIHLISTGGRDAGPGLLCSWIDAFKVLEVILVMTEGGPGLSTEILALRISRTATEFRELGVAAAMSNYLLLLLLTLTVAMFAFTRFQEIRAARIRAAVEEDE